MTSAASAAAAVIFIIVVLHVHVIECCVSLELDGFGLADEAQDGEEEDKCENVEHLVLLF